jgi:hypothetical protein
MNKRVKTLLVVLLLLSCTDIDLQKIPEGSDLKKFDSVHWKSEDSKKLNADVRTDRQYMLKDLLVNVLLGKSKSEIEDLLGPLETRRGTRSFSSVDNVFSYYLGPERRGGLGVGSEWLFIWVDDLGKFKKYAILSS